MNEAGIPMLDDGPLPCPQCGYDLTGLLRRSEGEVEVRLPGVNARCPECGGFFDLAEIMAARERTSWIAPLLLPIVTPFAFFLVLGVALKLDVHPCYGGAAMIAAVIAVMSWLRRVVED